MYIPAIVMRMLSGELKLSLWIGLFLLLSSPTNSLEEWKSTDVLAAATVSTGFETTMTTTTVQRRRQQQRLRFAMVSGGSAFFEPVENGWNAKCDELDIDCQYIVDNSTWFNLNFNASEDITSCVPQMRQYISEQVDGMAVKCNVDHPVFQEAQDAGIPVIGFAGYHPGPIDAYVGTDNRYLGRTMARLLRQLKPEGGTYVTAHNGNSATERHEGFVKEIEKDNHRSDRVHWYEHPLDFNHTGSLGPASKRIQNMDRIASHNPTAILFMYQSPLRHPNYTNFIDRNRWRNITYLGTEGNGGELQYMARRYIDGLVGQLTWDMGSFAVEMLHQMVIEGKESVPKVLNTKLVNYHLVPEELPPLQVDQSLLGHLRIIGISCFGIVAMGSLTCLAWTIYHYESTVVKASQPFFLAMTAGGTFLMSSALIPLSFDDKGDDSISDNRAKAICMSVPWLGFIGFTVTFSALFAKTWRVNQFFHSSSSHSRIQVSERDVLAPFGILLTLNIIVLVCWTILDPLTYTREFEAGTDVWNREIASNGSCRSDKAAAFLIPLGLINFSVLVIACWQAYEARDIRSEFSEAKYIGLAIFSLSQGFLTGVPIVTVVRHIPEAQYLVLTFLLLIVSMVVLLLIFLPKMLLERRYSTMTPQEQRKAMAVSVRLSGRQSQRRLSSTTSISGLQQVSKHFKLNVEVLEEGHESSRKSAPPPDQVTPEPVSSNPEPTNNTTSIPQQITPLSTQPSEINNSSNGLESVSEVEGTHVERIDDDSMLPAKFSSYLSEEIVFEDIVRDDQRQQRESEEVVKA